MFKFSKGVDLIYPESSISKEEKQIIKFKELFSAVSNTPLSKREKEVLDLLAKGYSAKLIANQYNLSIRTIQNYVEHLKIKLNLKSKYQLIDYHETFFPKF